MGSAPQIDWLRFLFGSTLVGELHVYQTDLTNTQIKALPSGAVTVSPTPPAAKYCLPVFASIKITATAGLYTNIDANCYGWIGANLGTSPESIALQTSYLANDPGAASLSYMTQLFGSATINEAWVSTQQWFHSDWGLLCNVVQNIGALYARPLALKIINGSAGDFTGGNAANTGVVKVFYLVL
jgi:hypothetical protein